MHPAIQAGRVAVITGSASGIGLAAARAFASHGLHIVLADLPTNLQSANESLRSAFPDIKILPVETDVSNFSSLENLKKKVDSEFKGKEVGVLMFNAGISRPTAPFARDGLDQETLRANYETILNTNMWGVINGVQAFLPDLVKQKSPSAVICTGSKQGITNPPGNPAYNISKTAVKFYTESLAYDLRTNYPESPISVHLLIPGWVYTGMTRGHHQEKPAGAWTPDQCVAHLIDTMNAGEFYALCEDNDVKRWQDERRMQWNVDDVIKRRSALSRWDDKYKSQYEEYMAKK